MYATALEGASVGCKPYVCVLCYQVASFNTQFSDDTMLRSIFVELEELDFHHIRRYGRGRGLSSDFTLVGLGGPPL